MFKILVCVSILFACGYIGSDIANKFKNRHRLFYELIKLFENIRHFISVTRDPVINYFLNCKTDKTEMLYPLIQNIKEVSVNNYKSNISELFFMNENKEILTLLNADESAALKNMLNLSKTTTIDTAIRAFDEMIIWLKNKHNIIETTEVKRGGIIKKVSLLAAVIAIICLI